MGVIAEPLRQFSITCGSTENTASLALGGSTESNNRSRVVVAQRAWRGADAKKCTTTNARQRESAHQHTAATMWMHVTDSTSHVDSCQAHPRKLLHSERLGQPAGKEQANEQQQWSIGGNSERWRCFASSTASGQGCRLATRRAGEACGIDVAETGQEKGKGALDSPAIKTVLYAQVPSFLQQPRVGMWSAGVSGQWAGWNSGRGPHKPTAAVNRPSTASRLRTPCDGNAHGTSTPRTQQLRRSNGIQQRSNSTCLERVCSHCDDAGRVAGPGAADVSHRLHAALHVYSKQALAEV